MMMMSTLLATPTCLPSRSFGVGWSGFVACPPILALLFRRWKIVYTIRGDDIIGRVWPAAMSEADMETSL